MNAHDFTTPIKTRLVEKMAEIALPGDKKLNGFQFYDSGTAAVEAGLRVMPRGHGQVEFISFHVTSTARPWARSAWPGWHARPGPAGARGSSWSRGQSVPLLSSGRTAPRVRPALTSTTSARVIREETVGRRCGLRARADPGLGRQRDAAGRFLPEASRPLRRIRHPADGRRSAHQHGPHRQVALHAALGRGARRGDAGQGVRQRFPGDGDGGARAVQGSRSRRSAPAPRYGGNPMACAAALAIASKSSRKRTCCERAAHLGDICSTRMKQMKAESPIVGDVRARAA